MGRGLGLLAGIIVIMVLLTVGATYWMGPKLAHLAFVDARRSDPFTVLDFVRIEPESALTARYQQPLAGLFASEGGQLLADYRQLYLLEGRRQDEWQQLNVLRMDRAQDLAQIMTSSPYRLIRRSAERVDSMKLGSYDAAAATWRAALVLWTVDLNLRIDDPLQPIREQLANGPGRLVWDTAVEPFENDARWQRVLAVDFASAREALAWLRNDTVATARVLVNARARDVSLGIYERGAVAGY